MRERKPSIKKKLIRANLVLVLLPIVIFSIVLYTSMKVQIKKESIEKSEKALSQIAKNIDAVVESSINLTNLYYFDQNMIDILTKIDDMNPVEKMQHRTQLQERFLYHNIILGYNGCYTAVFDKNGDKFFAWNMIGYDFESIGIGDMVEEIDMESSNRLIWIGEQVKSVRCFNEEKHVLFVVRRLLEPYSNNDLGILVMGIDEDVLYQRYQDMVDEENEIYILNKAGLVISARDKSLLGKPFQSSYTNALLENRPIQDKKLMVSVNTLERTGWKIVQTIPHKSLLSPLENFYPLMFFTIISSLGLSTWLSYHLSSGIARPITELTHFVHSLDGEHLTERIEVQSDDEIGELAKGFNNLTERLQGSIKALVQSEREKRKAEYEMLQAKINPHFLFNTLSTVRCLINQKELQKSEEVLISLGRLLRATLGRHDELITIGDELVQLNHYLLIQKMRYQDRFVYKIEMEPTIYSCQIIQLVLQPIVENAIFHGGENEGRQIEIRVKGVREGDTLLLSVSDTGNGMSEARIQEILDKKHNTPKHLFSGIGLKNIMDRIELYYGDGYGLWIQSTVGEGTTVQIRIPAREEEGGVT